MAMTAAVDSSSSAVISQVRSPYIGGGYVAGSEAWHTVLEFATNCITGKHTGSPRLEPRAEFARPRSCAIHSHKALLVCSSRVITLLHQVPESTKQLELTATYQIYFI